MKLNKTELNILSYLIERRESVTLGQLANKLGMNKSNASVYVKKLEKYRLVNVSKTGRTKQITGSYAHFLSFSKVKEKLPHLGLEDLLTGKTPYFLSYIDWLTKKRLNERGTADFGIKDINLPEITTRRILAKMSSLGVIYSPSKGRYSIRAEAEEAFRFCREMLTGIYAAEAEKELSGIFGIRISFETPEKAECVFITQKESTPKNYWPTAYTALSAYGIKLIGRGSYYYTNIKPKIADIIIHMLAVYTDARTIMYVCVLLAKYPDEFHNLYKKKNRFGISDEFISDLMDFIETKGQRTPDRFPSWEEVASMIKDYGIGVANG